MKTDEIKKVTIKIFQHAITIIKAIIDVLDSLYNLLPLDKINKFLTEKKIKIDVKSRIFKYFLSACVILIIFIACSGGEEEQIPQNSKNPTEVAQKQPEQIEHVEQNINLPPGRPELQLLEYSELGDLNVVKFLIVKKNANVNGAVYRHNNESALHIALRNKFNDIAEYLIKKGADVNAKDKDQYTPFVYPLQNCDYHMMELLLQNNAEKFIGAVFYAVNTDNAKLLDFLLKHDFPVNIIDNDGNTPLHIAIKDNRSYEVVKLLLQNKENVNAMNKRGDTPLYLALKNNRTPAILKLLFQNGANINTVDGDGNTPLHFAFKNNLSLEIISLLLQNNPNVNAVDNNGNTVLHLVVNEFISARYSYELKYSPIPNSATYVRMLLSTDIDINKKNKQGKTAIQLTGNTDVINQLLKHNANVTRDNADSRIYCILSNNANANAEWIEALIKAGANPEISVYGETALRMAVRENNKPVAAVIIKYSNFSSGQPMHNTGIAYYMVGMPELVKSMIDKGKHLDYHEIKALPLDIIKYYLQKNIGGGLQHEECDALLRKLAKEGMEQSVDKNGWSELIENSSTEVSWNNIGNCIYYKNYELAIKLIPKLNHYNADTNDQRAVDAIIFSGNDKLIEALILSKKVPAEKLRPSYIISNKKYSLLKKIIASGLDLNVTTTENLLLKAIDRYDVEAVKILLDAKASPITQITAASVNEVCSYYWDVRDKETGKFIFRIKGIDLLKYSIIEYAFQQANKLERAYRNKDFYHSKDHPYNIIQEIISLFLSKLPSNYFATRGLYLTLHYELRFSSGATAAWVSNADGFISLGANLNCPEIQEILAKIWRTLGHYENTINWFKKHNLKVK